MAGLPRDAEAWDDSLIVEMFNSAVEMHVRGGGGRKRKGGHSLIETDEQQHQRSRGAGIPGEWQAVSGPSVFDSEEGQVEDEGVGGALPRTSALFRQGLQSTATQVFAPLSASTTGDPMIDQALQDMLHSWYACGVATGKYQALLELQASNKSRNE